jgi:hypothetical protein
VVLISAGRTHPDAAFRAERSPGIVATESDPQAVVFLVTDHNLVANLF